MGLRNIHDEKYIWRNQMDVKYMRMEEMYV
jgi:hypothetical protein